MPRPRRTRQKHVDLASLIERARHHPYNLRRRKAVRGRNGGGGSDLRMLWNKNVTPGQEATATATAEQPIVSDRQHQRLLHYVPSANASVITVRSSNSQLHLAFGEVEIPCCTTEAPTATIMHIPVLRRKHAAVQPIHHDQLSTIVLHRNLQFDGEGTTRSGLLKSHNSKTNVTPVMEATTAKNKSASQKKADSGKTRGKNCDSDGSSVSYVSIHGNRRRRGSVGGSSGSRAAQTCSASMASSANSEKSKSDSDESNSFDENNDNCMMALKASTKFNLTLDMQMEIEREMALQAAASPINPTTTPTTTGMPPDRDEELPPPPNSPAVPHTATTTCNISAGSNNTLANILQSVDNFLKTVTAGKTT